MEGFQYNPDGSSIMETNALPIPAARAPTGNPEKRCCCRTDLVRLLSLDLLIAGNKGYQEDAHSYSFLHSWHSC